MNEKRPETMVARPLPERVALKKKAKRDAILRAAIEEFSENGFAGARLSAVAERAGVAKGTLYLYFNGKEDLFAGVVRESLPAREEEDADPPNGRTALEVLHDFLLRSAEDLQTSGRAEIAMVALTEGHHFPHLVQVYIEAVLDPILARVAKLTEIDPSPQFDTIRRFPQLVLAPVLAGLLWNRFMTAHPKIDLVRMLEAQLSLVAGRR